MSTEITDNTSLADFRKIIAEGNEEAWNIVSKIISDYKYEVVQALIDSGLRGEQIVKAYLDREGKLVFWIMSKYENKNI
jgi:hypothetical protein